MPGVRILPEILSNKIAAGEVVERPASVVKELVENAIDAGGDRIHIDIEKGGRSLIRVADNGCGMGHDDALLAIERYATSKIASETDLDNITSLGFRGEALPSIAAVSRLKLVTRDEHADAGTEILVEGGKIRSVNPAGAPVGTMITVRQLFFNTPARRKFLKTITTEFGHIADTVSCIALSRPEIRFRLTHNGKTVREWHNAGKPAARMADVLGKNLESLLYPVSEESDAVSVSGRICDPGVTRSTAGKIYTFVNGRYIRDRGLQHAVVEGYRGRIMKGRFPVAVLHLQVPPGDVDVNVHPAKHEVRFARHREIHGAVVRAVAGAFAEKTFRGAAGHEKTPIYTVNESLPGFAGGNEKEAESLFGARSPTATEATTPGGKADAPEAIRGQGPSGPLQTGATAGAPPADAPAGTPDNTTEKAPPPRQSPLFDGDFLRSAALIGQFKNTYILCERGDELLLIDQHAAHERIVYENIRHRMASGDCLPVQKLLVPEAIELSHRESAALEPMMAELQRAGLEIDIFGQNTFIVTAVPEVLAEKEISPLIREIAEIADTTGFQKEIDTAIDACIIRMACHGAIRANQALGPNQMKAIIDQLHACDNPNSCPHGRPTLITWNAGLLERRFKRTV